MLWDINLNLGMLIGLEGKKNGIESEHQRCSIIRAGGIEDDHQGAPYGDASQSYLSSQVVLSLTCICIPLS